MGKSSETPQAPDPAKVIPLQEAANSRAFQQTVNAMRPTEVTPYGTSSWTNNRSFDEAGYNQALADWKAQTQNATKPQWVSYGDSSFPDQGYWSVANPGATTGPAPTRDQFMRDNWTRTVALDPAQQALLDRQNANSLGMADQTRSMLDTVRSTYAQPLNLADSLPEFKSYAVGSPERQHIEDALLRRIRAEQDPRLERQRHSLQDQLVQTGFNVADQPYWDTMSRFDFDANRADADAVDRAILLGGQEAKFGAGENARSLAQALQEASLKAQDRGRVLNEFNAFRTGSQMTMPQTQGSYAAPSAQAPDVQGAYQQYYDNMLGAANAQNASSDNFLSGLMGLGGAFLGGPQGSAAATLMSKLFG